MPKFYRQNKKRIDPRYFLNETTYRGVLDENTLSPGQRNYWSSQIYFYIQKNMDKPEFKDMEQQLRDTAERASASRADREGGLSDEEIKSLLPFMTPEKGSLQSFADAVANISSSSTGDSDGDGSSDAEELMQIAQSLKDQDPSA
tara:strand:- start:8207 stop:8641 length:435 start_codon:yes stop_codon:yes gene_type:complete